MSKPEEKLITAEPPKELAVIEGTETLNDEAKDLLVKLVNENDADKIKDLTYLFNVNQTKKTMVQQDKLDELRSIIMSQLLARYKSRPDEVSTEDLMMALRVVQDAMERGAKQINGGNDPQPMITINQQNNEVNIGKDPATDGLNRESREKVKNASMKIIEAALQAGKLTPSSQDQIIEATAEVKEAAEGDEQNDR